MPAIVDVKAERKLNLKFSRTKVFNFLTNSENIGKLFPKIESKTKLGEEVWRLKFKSVVVSGVNHEIEFVIDITHDKTSNIKWSPKEGSNTNSKVLIVWVVSENGISDSIVTLELRGRYEVPVPRLMQRLAETVIKDEVNDHLNTAIEQLNLTTFG